MTHRIARLDGDGIGPEVMAVAVAALDAAGFDAAWVPAAVGWREWCTAGDALPAATRTALDDTEACLFGAITSKSTADAARELAPHLQGRDLRYASPIVQIRMLKGLHTNIRPNRTWPGVASVAAQHQGPEDASIGTVVFRENTEDLYADCELRRPTDTERATLDRLFPNLAAYATTADDELALTLRVTTARATERIVRSAFEHAARAGHPRVTIAEKANVMRATGGLVLDAARRVAQQYPDIQLHEANADALAVALVQQPQAYPVIVATNLLGDILSDLASGVYGGLGLAASANVGDTYALFEPVHGSAPDIAGQGIANPLACVLSGAMLARHLGEAAVADRIEGAVAELLRSGTAVPRDLGGTASTRDVQDALIALIEAGAGEPVAANLATRAA